MVGLRQRMVLMADSEAEDTREIRKGLHAGKGMQVRWGEDSFLKEPTRYHKNPGRTEVDLYMNRYTN